MSAKVSGDVWELVLTPTQRLVLLALADHADHEGKNVYPSTALLLWKTGLSETATHEAIRALKSAGILVPTDNPQGGRGHTVVYEIHTEKGTPKEPFVRFKSELKGAPKEPICTDKGCSKSTLSDEERVRLAELKGAPGGVSRAGTLTEPSEEPSLGGEVEKSNLRPTKKNPASKPVGAGEKPAVGHLAMIKFQRAYRAHYGVSARVTGQDGTQLKTFRLAMTEEEYDGCLALFFGTTDQYVVRQAHSIKSLCANLNLWLNPNIANGNHSSNGHRKSVREILEEEESVT